MKIGKYAFNDEAQANSKIQALGVETDEEGNEYPTHSHAIVRLGHIVLEQGEYDAEGNEITAPVLSDDYHLDVAWRFTPQYDDDGNEIEQSHPYGWASYAVTISDGNGVHSFYGVDYQSNKL